MHAPATADLTSISTFPWRWAAPAGDLQAPRLSHAIAVDLMSRAHEACPYSRATRGNVEVTLTAGGETVEQQAA